MSADQHAVITGANITGRIPHADGWVDVTPDVLYFTDQGEALAVADSIEVEHHVRGTHPIQQACRALDDREQYPDLPDDIRAAHRAEHAALNERMGS